MPPLPSPSSLLRFNQQVLSQALALIAAHRAPGAPAYAQPVGAHLRHVIEHYEALLLSAEPGVVDYDRRPRDRQLECDPAIAQARVQALQRLLVLWATPRFDMPLHSRGIGGLAGDFEFTVTTTLARELVFVASHAIHHYALLAEHCRRHGIDLGAGFGHAPATVAHGRATVVQPIVNSQLESACHA